MKALLAGCLGLLASGLAPAHAQVEMRLDVEPQQAEIGQPVTLVLTAEHPSSFTIELPESVLADETWLLHDELGKLTLPHPSRDGLAVTVARWEIASLDSGEREFAFPDVRWTDGNSAGLSQLEPVQLKIATALLEGEDAPREARGFRTPELEAEQDQTLVWILVCGSALALAILFLMRQRGQAKSGEELPPRARLESLRERCADLGVRESYFELTRLVRAALDEHATERPVEQTGLTDEEWLAALEPDTYSPETAGALAEFFAHCEEVKYGLSEPTRWAFEESLTRARSLVDDAQQSGSEVAA